MVTGRTPLLLLLLTLSLIAVGITMVYSASANEAGRIKRAQLKKENPQAFEEYHRYHDPGMVLRQIMYAAMGIVLMLAFSAIDHHRLRSISPALLFVTFVMLILVFVPGIGHESKGAARWINLRFSKFQPSELAKLALIIHMARLMLDRQQDLDSFRRGLLPALIITGVFCCVIVVEPDFGAAVMLGLIVFGMWYVGGMNLKYLISLVVAVVPIAVAAVVFSPYRMKRIMEWIDLLTKGLQEDQHVSQSVIAIGSGGLHGLGLGQSMQKYAFLHEAHTDFIFAVIGEEFGFIRSSIVVLMFFFLIMAGWRVSLRASDSFGGHLAAGITFMIALSVSLNLLVVLGYLPPKGLALPFISYGGSSMVVNCAAMGILINVAKYNERAAPIAPRRRRR